MGNEPQCAAATVGRGMGLNSIGMPEVTAKPAIRSRFVERVLSIGADATDDNVLALQKRVTVGLTLISAVPGILWGLLYLGLGAPLAAVNPGGYGLFCLANTAAFAVTRRLGPYRFLQLTTILLLPFSLMLALGGFKASSAVVIWSLLCPLAALLIADLKQAVFWFIAVLALLLISAIADPYLSPASLPAPVVTSLFALNIAGVLTIVFGAMYYFVAQRNYFQERSETLLLNVLPKEIAEILKDEQRSIADYHEAASILFADVVHFTQMSAAMTPQELVGVLDEVFLAFDRLVEKYEVEKIKTIGDCYMVAAGVPHARPDHAQVLARLALDMLDLIAKHRYGGRALNFRIGINSGPVVAGVIGRRKFIYDLWGDAVNVASRMESHGQSGAIQITRNTYDLIKDQFVCVACGSVEIKGHGTAEVWHVLG
jgi:adenylate cyclase